MSAEFVTARHKGVVGRIRVPKRSLKYMPGWEIVTDDTRPSKRTTPAVETAAPMGPIDEGARLSPAIETPHSSPGTESGSDEATDSPSAATTQ